MWPLWLGACVIEGPPVKKFHALCLSTETKGTFGLDISGIHPLNFSFQFYLAIPNQCFVLYALFNFDYVCLFVCDCLSSLQVSAK
jgi:hypothetical protein